MKKEMLWILVALALSVVGYVLFSKGGAGVARVKTWVGARKQIITGTASKGNDSGGVLTQSA